MAFRKTGDATHLGVVNLPQESAEEARERLLRQGEQPQPSLQPAPSTQTSTSSK